MFLNNKKFRAAINLKGLGAVRFKRELLLTDFKTVY